METEGLLMFLYEPNICPYPKPTETNSHPYILFP